MTVAENMTKNIAWIYPGPVERIFQDFFEMAPSSVNLFITTRMWAARMMHGGAFDAEAFDRQRATILDAAREAAKHDNVGSIVISGDLIQCAMGLEWNRRLCEDMESETGLPSATAMTAFVDGLRHLGARKVAVATPFRDDQNEHIRKFLGEAGFELAAMQGIHTTSPQDVRSLSPETPREVGIRVFNEAQDAEALYMPCPIWPGVTAAIEPLEEKVGVPVLSMFNVLLWKALRLMGYSAPVTGYGRILGDPSG